MPKINKSYQSTLFEYKFNKLPQKIQDIADAKILLFENNFLHPSLNTHKLKGHLSSFWSFYITKSYRILFKFLENNEVIYYDIDDHDIYKR